MCFLFIRESSEYEQYGYLFMEAPSQDPEEMCLLLAHQNSSETSGKNGYFDHVTVSLHIVYTANQETLAVIDFQNGEQQSRSGSDKKRRNRLFIKIPLG